MVVEAEAGRPATDGPGEARAWREVATLGVSQIVGYGTLYYAFALLAPAMAADFGWPDAWMFGARSAALLAGGLLAPWTGRWIDRFGAGRVMTAGSLAAALALAGCAFAPSGPAFVAGLIAIEMAATLVQYGAAFPLCVQRHGARAQRSIVHLTLIAGFASTLFWPLTTWLAGLLDWRQVYLVFAAMNLLVCLPIHAALSRPLARPLAARPPIEGSLADSRRGTGEIAAAVVEAPAGGLLPADRRGRGFALMAAGFAFQSFVGSAVLVHMLPMLGALGLGLAGVAVGTLFGPSQVASRLINMLFGRGLSQLTLAVVSAAALPAALLLLLASAPSFPGAMVFAVVFGMGHGLYSIVGGTLPLALFGARGYGARQGRIMAVRLVVGAAAPFAFALAMDRLGAPGALALTAFCGALAVVAFAAIGGLLPRRRPDEPAAAE